MKTEEEIISEYRIACYENRSMGNLFIKCNEKKKEIEKKIRLYGNNMIYQNGRIEMLERVLGIDNTERKKYAEEQAKIIEKQNKDKKEINFEKE